MKCAIPQISWHNREPVLSIDLQPQSSDGLHRLATGGTDSHVLMWSVTVGGNGEASVKFLSDLAKHQRSVNAVRFSPNGEILASGDDDAIIILWILKPKSDIPDLFANKDSEEENKENWTVLKCLRGHLEDVYDICWSPDSSKILSGSVDNIAVLWDVSKGKPKHLLSEQKGFVQGVAWDPRNKFVATLSSDRSLRVYSLTTNKVVHKQSLVQIKNADGENKTYKLFHDDTLKTFCRRLNFSPDGLILFAPCGLLELNELVTTTDESESAKKEKKTYATYAFIRGNNFSKPVAYYPSDDGGYSVAVRCCPILFELRPGQPSLFEIPYRMIFAIVTENSILLYDTQGNAPFAKIAHIHYAHLTDVAWSSNGRIIVVSSMDGYCSIVTFGDGELGKPYENVKCVEEEVSPNLPSSFQTLLQGEIFQENFQPIIMADDEDSHLAYEESDPVPLDTPAAPCPPTNSKLNSKCSTALKSPNCPSVRNSPRRINLITLSSPKK